MKKEVKNTEYQNDWAKTVKDDPIHIDHAKSGLKGYYCLGCSKEMQAVKFKNKKYQSYFRHHAHNINKENIECVVASKNYRERLAEQILHRLKEIKVPTLLKYPPRGQETLPMFLEESKLIKAYKVRSQLSFYEDENGEIKWGKNPDIDERYLLIRPDITFFDENENPILFIEFVISHKIKDEKKIKLSRLGINTVQIIIPKLPENEIEKALKSVRRIKWVYNEIESNTNYIPPSKGDSERVFPIDEEQRKLLEESFNCSMSKVNDLIRSITKCLGTQSYRNIEQLFEREISRIENATEREREELAELERKYDAEVFSNIAGEFELLDQRREALREEQEQFQKYIEGLERRYANKIREIGNSERDIGKAQAEFSRSRDSQEEIRDQFEFDEKVSRANFEHRTAEVRRNIIRESNTIESKRNFKEEFTAEFKQLEREEQERYNKQTESLRVQEEEIEDVVRREIKRDLKHNTAEFPEGIRNLLEVRRMASDFQEWKRKEDRYKRARDLLNKGTWKTR